MKPGALAWMNSADGYRVERVGDYFAIIENNFPPILERRLGAYSRGNARMKVRLLREGYRRGRDEAEREFLKEVTA